MKYAWLIFIFLLAACSTTQLDNSINNQNLGFNEYPIEAFSFLLTSYERVGRKNDLANIYIEGDGRAWLNKHTPSLDPTPKNPVALKLATIDPSDNVIYLARPCQYTKTVDGSSCDQKYWTSHRFTPEVVDSMNTALDDVKRRHSVTNFNLIGFSGGGNIAALLAVLRDDVVSLRTIAGNLDHQLQSSIHNVSPMPESLNAKDVANKISHIPQIHFVGGQDKIVPAQIAQSYKAVSQSNCVKIQVVESASHTKGWKSVWKSLLRQPFDCEKR